MMQGMRRLSFYVVLGIIFGFAICHMGTASADSGFSLTTTPVSADLSVTPGTTSSTVLQVMNNGTAPLQISLELETFSANGTNGDASITQLAPGDPAATWVHFSENTFSAQPGVWTPIKMTITLPTSASLGYYYAVLFKPTLPTPTAQHTTTIKGSNAILVLVDTRSANEKRQLKVTNFSVSKSLYEYLPASFSVTVHNDGNIYLPPAGDIYISKQSDFSHVLATLPINSGSGNVLPQSVRIFQASWTDGFPVNVPVTVHGVKLTKNGVPVTKLKWNLADIDKFRIGKYYAHLALVYNNGTQDIPIESVVSFWVFPWKLFTVIVVFILLVLLGLFGLGRSFYRRLRRRKAPVANTPK